MGRHARERGPREQGRGGGLLRARVGLVLAALRWRRASSVAVLLAAASAFAAAGLGPLWATASRDALGTERVRTAEVVERQVVVEQIANERTAGSVTVPVLARRNVDALVDAVDGAAAGALGPSRGLLTTLSRLQVRSESAYGLSLLAWLDDDCASLRFVRGRCGPGPTDVVVSDRTAAALGLSVGEPVSVPELGVEPVRPGSGDLYPTEVVVTGVYRTTAALEAGWSDTQLFRTAPARTFGDDALPPLLDAVFVPLPLLDDLSRTDLTASARRSLLPSPRTADELAAVERSLRRWQTRVEAESGGVAVRAPAVELLAGLRPEGDAARRAALLLGGQLLALSCCVLALVVAGSADARAPDVALGRLRGLRRRSLVAFSAAEPLALVLLAAPVGVLAGVLGTAALAGGLLPGEVRLRADPSLLAALLAALAGAVVAVAVGARRVLARGVLGAADDTGSGTARLVGDAVVVTVAVLALWQITRQGSPDGAGLLAPVLAAVAAGLLLARLGRLLARSVVRRTAGRDGVAGWLAARRTARLDGGTRTVVLTAAALACACYAAVVLVVTDEQRGAQAAMEVGARTAYEVEPVQVTELLAAVDRADPSGTRLAPVARTLVTPGRPALLAVDAARLPAVAAWREEWAGRPLAQLAGGLAPPTSEEVQLTGVEVSVDVDVRRLEGSGAVLGLRVVSPGGEPRVVRLGSLRRGSNRLESMLGCAPGCRLTGVVLEVGQARALVGEVVLEEVRVDGEVVQGLLDPADWRPAPFEPRDPLSPPSTSLPGPDPGGLLLRFAQPQVEEVGIVRADVPEALPVLQAGDVENEVAGRDGLVRVPVRSQSLLLGEVAGQARVLPRLADEGYLVDLRLLQRAAPEELGEAVQEVWSTGPPDDAVVTALRDAGLEVVTTTTAAEREEALAQRGPARVLSLLPVLAVVALGLAVLGQVAQALAVARPRAVEAAGLQAVGVPRQALRRAAVRESSVQLALGTVAGAVAGVATALVTASGVGALGLFGPLAPFPESVPWGPVVAAVAAGTALLAVVTVGCARAGLGRRDPQLLRQAAG